MPLKIIELDENEFVCRATDAGGLYRWKCFAHPAAKQIEVIHNCGDVAFLGTIEELELYIAALKMIRETGIQMLKEEVK